MLRARIVTVGAAGFVGALVACVGGPGPLPDPEAELAQQGGSSTTIVGGGSSSQSGNGTNGSTSNGGGSSSGAPQGTSTSTPPALPQTIMASEFDQSCTQASDCVAVFQGAVCTACRCNNTAINVKDQGKYETTYKDRAKACVQTDVACRADCANTTPVCSSNRCTVVIGVIQDAGPG